MAIEMKQEGRRYYLLNTPYGLKDQLRSAGCNWDQDKRAWWTGKAEVALRFAAASGEAADKPDAERLGDATEVAGKARYKGTEYLLLWSGSTRKGPACKLAFTDGSKVFWASEAEVEVTKRYQDRQWRGRREPGMTFGRLQQLRAEYKQHRSEAQRLGAKDGLVGERSELCADFEASRSERHPGKPVGHLQWLKTRNQRIAVVLVGFELATFLRGEDAEDMGHFDVRSGWYGTLYFRPATLAEATGLQAREPREDAVMPAAEQAAS
jgi:hypothetical protein